MVWSKSMSLYFNVCISICWCSHAVQLINLEFCVGWSFLAGNQGGKIREPLPDGEIKPVTHFWQREDFILTLQCQMLSDKFGPSGREEGPLENWLLSVLSTACDSVGSSHCTKVCFGEKKVFSTIHKCVWMCMDAYLPVFFVYLVNIHVYIYIYTHVLMLLFHINYFRSPNPLK